MNIIADMNMAGIVLAAGGSTRMRGHNKLLIEIMDKPVLVRVVETIATSGLSPLVVVTGFEADRIKPILNEIQVQLVDNNRWQEGMSTSFQPAINVLPTSVTGAMIFLADMPAIQNDLVKKLLIRFKESREGKIVYPVFQGQQGHPVIFPRKFFPDLKNLTGDRGAKSILKDYPGSVLAVETDSPTVLMDIDTEDDLLELTRFIGN